MRALEIDRSGWVTGTLRDDGVPSDDIDDLRVALRTPTPERLFQVKRAMEAGIGDDELYRLTAIDPWFLAQLRELVEAEEAFGGGNAPDAASVRRMKRMGFSDVQLGESLGMSEAAFREKRWELGVHPCYKVVDTCAGEFPSATPYLYSSYDDENESEAFGDRGIIILGSGPNRIGQGVEFDYCCVRAGLGLREIGYRTIMINCNPETVSTDFDISDKLYFEPLTLEDVLEIVRFEQPKGVIVQLGGQTPLKLAKSLQKAGATILGTSPDAIDAAEDRKKFEQLASRLGVAQPASGTATNIAEALDIARRIGYPILVRPSYVLGGRAMQIVYGESSLREYFRDAVRASPDHPVLVDSFLEDAFEADVDALSDGEQCVIGGVMQHIEDAGVHSGDSACVLPPYLIDDDAVDQMRRYTKQFAKELGVVGLINVQFAVKNDVVYVLEVNPRGSRTVPFVSKATGVPLVKLAAALMVGQTLEELGVLDDGAAPYVAVKEAVFPFTKLPGVDTVLGPEMLSTGEVMGIADSFGMAFAKAQAAADAALPLSGTIFVSVNDVDKPTVTPIIRRFHEMGFRILATAGTARYLQGKGIATGTVRKLHEGRPHVGDSLVSGEVQLLINTPLGKLTQHDDYVLRRTALLQRVPYTTTISAAKAACDAILAIRSREGTVRSLQAWHQSRPGSERWRSKAADLFSAVAQQTGT